MVNKLRKLFRNEKGFTLVELLAVIVILGIIAAIAVPAVGSIIDNSKRDAHISNAKMIYEAARLYDVSEDVNNESGKVTLGDLIDEDYLEKDIEVPSGDGYSEASYVNTNDQNVVLFQHNNDNGTNGKYIDTTSDSDKNVSNLVRDDVELLPSN